MEHLTAAQKRAREAREAAKAAEAEKADEEAKEAGGFSDDDEERFNKQELWEFHVSFFVSERIAK